MMKAKKTAAYAVCRLQIRVQLNGPARKGRFRLRMCPDQLPYLRWSTLLKCPLRLLVVRLGEVGPYSVLTMPLRRSAAESARAEVSAFDRNPHAGVP